MERPKILYFVPEWPASTSGVLHSTVLEEAGFLNRRGFDCFFIGSDISNEFAAKAEKHIATMYGIRVKVFGCHSAKHGAFSILRTARKVAKLSKQLIANYHPTHIWTRLFTVARVGRKIARENDAISVLSVRSIISEEVASKRGRGIGYQLCRWGESIEIKKSDRLSAVTNQLRLWIQNLTFRDDIIVVPCCFNPGRLKFDDEARKYFREKYHFRPDDHVICYLGGLSEWQRVSDIVELFGDISKSRNNFKFFFITPQSERVEQSIEESGLSVSKCIVKSCLPDETPRYLAAADAGIIMRDDILINNVASPIKIAEYLGCGLPIIMTKGIGDYSEILPRAGIGLILDELGDTAQQVISFMERSNFIKLRKKAVAFAQENVSWSAHLNDLNRLFRS